MSQPFPMYALFNGEMYTFEKAVKPVFSESGNGSIVICSHKSMERYVFEDEWLKAAATFRKNAKSCGLVTSQSSAQEKIRLFRSLFNGRSDVYAHGYRKKDGGIGYSPACANEWRHGICPRTANMRTKCSDCANRLFPSLTDSTIVNHFKGLDDRLRDVIGLYALDNNSCTSFLVMDFDKKDWQACVSAIRLAAARHDLSVAVERSRSGNGGHVWFFFKQRIEAKLARDFGSALITEAMHENKIIGFDAYDRMFPAQSTIPEGGFGNLIAAPFQGKAQRDGNSVFIDDNFKPYADQWLFLSNVKKIDEQTVRQIAESHETGPLGALGKESDVPWRRQPCSKLSSDDFPEKISIVESDMIYLPEAQLTPRAANRIKRLAAFANPEFYRAQAMHQSVYGKQRIVWLGENRAEYLSLPRGCKNGLLIILEEASIDYEYKDKRFTGKRLRVRFNGTLRPEQAHPATILLKHNNGILSAPTGFGKTIIGAFIIANLHLPTLIIVPRSVLASQWIAKLNEFLDIEHPDGPLLTPSGKPSKRKRPVIGQIGGGKHRPTGIVDVATFQSLVEQDKDTGEPRAKDITRNYGLVICDECHHAAAPQLEMVLKATPARYVYGLSATPKRSDGLDRALFMLCGPIRYSVDPKAYADQQGIRRVLHPVFTRIRLAQCGLGTTYAQILDELCAHDARNELISKDVVQAAKNGATSLVLTKRKNHAQALAKLIAQKGCKAHLLIGEGTSAQRRKLLEEATQDASDKESVIVATESYLGEGFDFSRLDTLFLATPISWDGNIVQQAGRPHRIYHGKTSVAVWDYIDETIPMLARMHKKRLKTFAKMGYEVEVGEFDNNGHRAEFIGANNAMKLLVKDIGIATESIRIFAPYASPKAAFLLKEALSNANARGVIVECTTAKEPTKEVSSVLTAVNSAMAKSRIAASHAGLAIFDKRIIWYGSLPLDDASNVGVRAVFNARF